MSTAGGVRRVAAPTLVVFDELLLPIALEQEFAVTAHPASDVVLLGFGHVQPAQLAEARAALGALGIQAEAVLGTEPDAVDALNDELDRREYERVVILVDHFAASALGPVDDAARALVETARRGVRLLFWAPRLVP